MAAPIYRGCRAKFFSWTTCKHDFEPFPSDRELLHDLSQIVVKLISILLRCPSLLRIAKLIRIMSILILMPFSERKDRTCSAARAAEEVDWEQGSGPKGPMFCRTQG